MKHYLKRWNKLHLVESKVDYKDYNQIANLNREITKIEDEEAAEDEEADYIELLYQEARCPDDFLDLLNYELAKVERKEFINPEIKELKIRKLKRDIAECEKLKKEEEEEARKEARYEREQEREKEQLRALSESE